MTDETTARDEESQAATVSPEEMHALFARHKGVIYSELKKRALSFVRYRWVIPIVIMGVAGLAQFLGFGFNLRAVIGVALLTIVYNAVFHALGKRIRRSSEGSESVYLFTCSQVGLDVLSVFLLVHFTGGVTSPLISFFFFNCIFVAILLPPRAALGFAGLTAVGLVLMAVAEDTGIISPTPLSFQGNAFSLSDKPWYVLTMLVFYTAAIFITALATAEIMRMLKKRIVENAEFYEQLEGLTEERWRFMRKTAHNLRAPLAAVTSMLDVMQEEYLGTLTPPQQEHLRRIRRRTCSMAELIDDMMSIAKSRTSRRPATPCLMALADVAGRITRTFEDEAALKGLAFGMAVPEPLAKTQVDLEVLEPVLENLLSNAIKYTREGEVKVAFEQAGAVLKITVQDTGIGIPQNDHQALFTEFFRSENARAVEEVGTGLGLALVKETIAQAGGRIEFESQENHGTRFDISLPLHPFNHIG